MFFFLFVPPRSFGRSSPNLVGRWRAAPDISSMGSFLKVKVIEVKSQICFFCLFLPGPWADLQQTWREGGGRPRILALVYYYFLKCQGHRGQSYVFFSVCSPTSPRPLGRSSPNLVGR